MEFIKTNIPGLFLIKPNTYEDSRGTLLKTFHYNIFRREGLECDFKESFFSVSYKNVIRGMHFQFPPYDHAKLIYVIQGSIIDVSLDIRKGSPTYGMYFAEKINYKNKFMIYIPRGCAHGYLSLENNATLIYMQTSIYVPEFNSGIRYDSFGMNWDVSVPIISKRDREFVPFNKFEAPFRY